MSLDERAFHFAQKTWKKFRKKSLLQEYSPNGYSVRDHAEGLSCLASAISEENLRIGFTEHWFGWDQRRLYCPEILRISRDAKTNQLFLTLQIAKLCQARKFSLVQKKDDRFATATSIFALIESSTYLQFPGFGQLKKDLQSKLMAEHSDRFRKLAAQKKNREILQLWDLCPPSLGPAESKIQNPDVELLSLLLAPIDSSLILQSQDQDTVTEDYHLSTGKEMVFKPKENIQLIQLPAKPEDDNPLVHNFEKLLTADEYKSGHKPRDGEDDLNEHQEALQELNLTQMVRTPEETKGILKSDLMVNFEVADAVEPEVTSSSYRYDEWNYKTKTYKKNWCVVSELNFAAPQGLELPAESSVIGRARLDALKREFILIHNRRTLKRRVQEGHDIDLDAAVDHYISLATRSQVDERCDVSRPVQEKDLAILILMDLSLSTDGWTNNHRVIDLCKDAIGVLGEVLSPFHPLYSIYGFCSHTHRDCRFLKIKGNQEDWRQGVKRLAAIRPMGYTRIGPAIRHASAILQKTKAHKKLLLIVGDGKPNDYDQYEGRYGIQDVRQAVTEAQHLGISTQCIAIDKSAKSYLNIMFSRGNYHLLASPLRLAETLSKIFRSALYGT